MDIYTKEFKNYCDSLITKHEILITNQKEWHRSIWQKGWNQYQLIYNLYTKNGYKKITDVMLIDLYKANIRIRNVLYEFSLLIEESFKAWLYFKKIDNTNTLNNETLGKLIKSVNDIDKQNFLIRILAELNLTHTNF